MESTWKKYTIRSKKNISTSLDRPAMENLEHAKFHLVWLLVLTANTCCSLYAKPKKNSVQIDVFVDAFLTCTYSGWSLPKKT